MFPHLRPPIQQGACLCQADAITLGRALEMVTDPALAVDAAAAIVAANRAAEGLLAGPAGTIVGRPLEEFVPELLELPPQGNRPIEVGRLVADLIRRPDPVRLRDAHGETLLAYAAPVVDGICDTCPFTVLRLRPLFQRRRIDDALRAVMVGTAPATGAEFYRALARHLATALKVRCAFMAELQAPDRARTLAFWANGDFVADAEYCLSVTPCSQVVGQTIRHFPHDVQLLFPQDRMLAQLGLHSYLGAPIFGTDGESLGVLAILDDRPMEQVDEAVTILGIFAARVGAEIERDRAERALRQAQKMEAVGQLTGGVAHDFNNLLTVVRANADLLATSVAPDGEARAQLDELRLAAERGAAMIRKLLAFGRRDHLEITAIDLGRLAAEHVGILRRLLPEHIHIATAAEDGLPPVRGDVGVLEQILLNLATNARDAMPEGGRIAIGVRRPTRAELQEVRTEPTGGEFVCLDVSDTGTGMDAATQARVFEPFFTTKPRGKGTGLGLAMVRNLVRQHGGGLRLRSAPGAGTTISLYFPVATAATAPARTTAAATGELPKGRGEVVLVVEDEPAIRRVAETVLSRHGYRVRLAEDGETAWELLRTGARVDLVISDLCMPRLGGLALRDRLRAAGDDVPFLLASGYADAAHGTPDATAASNAGPVLNKPWTVLELLCAARSALDDTRGGTIAVTSTAA